MHNGPYLFLGIFFTLALSWAGIVLSNQIQYGNLAPYRDEIDGTLYPRQPSGLAQQGKQAYLNLGCIYCHSQQVRRPGYGADDIRGWGERQSVARDYIHQRRVVLGTSRTGPDLMTVGDRISSAEWHYLHLYDPVITSEGSIMPSYRFLFEKRKIVGEPSPKALSLPSSHAVPEGYEVVPTPRAEALVSYLLSLRHEYDYPESLPVDLSEEEEH